MKLNFEKLKLGNCQALLELEMKSDFKSNLHELKIKMAKQIKLDGAWRVILIVVPVSQLKRSQKIQVHLVCELEKKFTMKHVFFIALGRILLKPT